MDQTVGGSTGASLPERGDHVVLWVAHHLDATHVGKRIPLEAGKTYILGRSRPDLGKGILDDPRISRHHITMRVERDHVHITDQKSRNGTMVNGRTISVFRAGDGDVIRMGSVRFIVRRGGPPRDPLQHPRIIGVSDALYDLIAEAQVVAPRDTTVLLLGESGVGKDLFAEEIHRASQRHGAFVAANCGSVAETLVQSELFGHMAGAFSSALSDRAGLATAAEHGTLFLDEIGTAPPSLQTALLRMLQNREFRSVGSDIARPLTARIVAATNVLFSDEIEAGRFRGDLWGRLQRWVLAIPPLRERPEDIVPLALHFARTYEIDAPILEGGLVDRLLAWRYPNNVRELEGIVERLAATAEDNTLRVLPWLAETLPHPSQPQVSVRLSEPPRRNKRPTGPELRACLQSHGANIKETAKELGVGRNTLYRWMKDADIDHHNLE